MRPLAPAILAAAALAGCGGGGDDEAKTLTLDGVRSCLEDDLSAVIEDDQMPSGFREAPNEGLLGARLSGSTLGEGGVLLMSFQRSEGDARAVKKKFDGGLINTDDRRAIVRKNVVFTTRGGLESAPAPKVQRGIDKCLE